MTRLAVLCATLCISACGGASGADSEPKHPEQELGEPSDEIDPDLIGEAVRANAVRFQMCYEEARAQNPGLAGRVAVRFLINTDGSVGQAQAVETSLPSHVSQCVVQAFYGLRLPQQEAAIIAQYPMFFQPS